MTREEVEKLAKECCDALKIKGALGTVVGTIYDAIAMERRLAANEAGAKLRDEARDLDAKAEEHMREGDGEEAELLHNVAAHLSKLSHEVYALGDPPKPEPEVECDIPF